MSFELESFNNFFIAKRTKKEKENGNQCIFSKRVMLENRNNKDFTI